MDWKGSRVNVFDLIGESHRQTATINKAYIDPCQLDLKPALVFETISTQIVVEPKIYHRL